MQSNLTDQTKALLPRTQSDLSKIMEDGTDDKLTVMRNVARTMGTNPRTPEWIRENGMCIENLVPGRSHIQQAGKGGIAQFAIKQGEIVAPAPMLQIVNRDVLDIYDEDGENVGTQLLMNYCFGHAESSLLLCPDTNAILINHCSLRTRECGPDGPNAKIQWASGWEKENDRWLSMSMHELEEQTGRGLAMEIVATRDIQPGEEVRADNSCVL